MVRGLETIVRLTILEARRRRISLAALLGGLAFVLIFGIAVYLIHREGMGRGIPLARARIQLEMLTLAGLYAANFLIVAAAILFPVDTLSGEIASGAIQTLASKPIPRRSIVLGKALAYWLMIAGYVVIMVGGVVLAMRLATGFRQPHVIPAMALILLEATVLLSIVIAGGTSLSTVANGITAFAFYAVAFVGGWIEQIGVLLGSTDARYIGTAVSLVSPTDALWRLAMHVLEPPVMAQVMVTPFTPKSVPTAAMVWWAVAFAVAVLSLAVYRFETRAL
jgi:Cu-processing system permease protein